MDLALGDGNVHLVAFNTSTPGMKSGMITISSASQAVQNGLVNFPVSFQVLPALLTGDYNQNGEADAADYVLWRDALGQNVPGGTGADGNADGVINDADYALWRSHFGQMVSASIVTPTTSGDIAVPEPAAGLMFLLAACLPPFLRVH